MCKHILINDFKKSDIETLKVFNELSIYEQDGFGAIARKKCGEIITLKTLDNVSLYIELTKMSYEHDIQTLVVHHRTSTNIKGIDYAHPFEFKGNYLTHNGVVSLPVEYPKTKTQNDSEKLLHHLIKTDFETKSIQGYFSCFIVTHDKTTVIVDDTAPIYTDGRIYCSHQLDESFRKIELVKIDLCKLGTVLSQSTIEVSRSNYGQDKAHLSLGKKGKGKNSYWSGNDWNDGAWSDFSDTLDRSWNYKDDYNAMRFESDINDFLDMMNDKEMVILTESRNFDEFRDNVQSLCYLFGIDLNVDQMIYLYDLFINDESQKERAS